MNKVYWCITSFCALVIVFSLGYYATFQYSNNEKSNQIQKQQLDAQHADENTVPADGKLKDRISADTILVEEQFNVSDATYAEKKMVIPESYVGLTREELVKQLSEQMKNISEEERASGLLSMTLTSFTKEKICVRKVYDDKTSYQYFITEKDGYLIVFLNDKTTVFETTDIVYSNLSDSQKREVNDGVYVTDEEELYSILESYSS